MTSSPPLLQVEGLRVAYASRAGTLEAVSDVSFAIAKGESYGLVGESGCGKSSIVLAIMRYLGANGCIAGGRVLFEGRDLATMDDAALRAVRGARVAMVYQEPASALNPSMTVGRQLAEVPMAHAGASKEEALRRAAQVLADVRLPDPEAILARYPHQLSGGQQQRVVIAMALLAKPTLMLLDEPTTGLDATVEAAVVDLIADLRGRYGTSLLYISHNLGLISKVCDRVGVMYAGQLVEEGPIREVFARPRHPYTRGLLSCLPTVRADKRSAALVPIPGQVPSPRDRPPGCVFQPRCAHAVAGRCDAGPVAMSAAADRGTHGVRCVRWTELGAAEAMPPAASAVHAAPAQGVAIAVEGLSKHYQTGRTFLAALRGARPAPVKANDDVSVAVPPGRTLAIVGESGCGKSTLAKVITGLERATAGRVAFGGSDLAMTPVERRRPEDVRGIQMVFQNPDGTLNPSHSVGWTIGRALRKLRGRSTPVDVAAMLERVRLPAEAADRKPRQLSGGQRQRVAIARALAGDPTLVVMDEPTSALDVSVQAAIVNLVLEMQAREGIALVFISHDLGLVRYLADHVAVMYLGKVVESGPASAVFAPPYHPYTEALLSAVPVADPRVRQRRVRLEGDVPSAMNVPKGCRFAGRCPRKLPGRTCDEEPPPERWAAPDHAIACHIPVEALRKVPPVFEARTETESVSP